MYSKAAPPATPPIHHPSSLSPTRCPRVCGNPPLPPAATPPSPPSFLPLPHPLSSRMRGPIPVPPRRTCPHEDGCGNPRPHLRKNGGNPPLPLFPFPLQGGKVRMGVHPPVSSHREPAPVKSGGTHPSPQPQRGPAHPPSSLSPFRFSRGCRNPSHPPPATPSFLPLPHPLSSRMRGPIPVPPRSAHLRKNGGNPPPPLSLPPSGGKVRMGVHPPVSSHRELAPVKSGGTHSLIPCPRGCGDPSLHPLFLRTPCSIQSSFRAASRCSREDGCGNPSHPPPATPPSPPSFLPLPHPLSSR